MSSRIDDENTAHAAVVPVEVGHAPYESSSRFPEPVELCKTCTERFGVGMRWPCAYFAEQAPGREVLAQE
ncbi:hypothetical protein STSO111631_19415 [Stackebrandtia soli]